MWRNLSYIDDNQLSGSLPASLGSLVNLQTLCVRHGSHLILGILQR